MSNAIAIIGCLAFLCAVGYGIFHLICKVAKKRKTFFKKAVLAPSHRRIYPASDRRLPRRAGRLGREGRGEIQHP